MLTEEKTRIKKLLIEVLEEIRKKEEIIKNPDDSQDEK